MVTGFGRLIGHISDNPSHTALAVAFSVVVFGGIEFTIHETLLQLHMRPFADAVSDALLVGCSFGLAVWVLLLGNRERRMRVRRDLERIAELNHEIRNALQVIAYSYVGADDKCRALVVESVSRIDAVLRRVFPVVGGGKNWAASQKSGRQRPAN